MATVDNLIKQLQRAKRERVKELKEQHPDWDSKKLSHEAGQLDVVRETEHGRVEDAWLDYSFTRVYGNSGDWSYRALKLFLSGEDF